MRADEVARQPVSEPLAARLLALVEHWRLEIEPDQGVTWTRDCEIRNNVLAKCADELAAALRRIPPQLGDKKEDAARGDKGTLSEGLDLPHRRDGDK